ncbi:MAG: GTPase [Caldilineaceae bacterium]|nr:GTPase [Caldilineaceae bacterium]
MTRTRLLIMGAAGRDFHNFNVFYRNNPQVEVVAFTATQIPFIDDRRYPPQLAGPLYPDGILIHPEEELEGLIHEYKVEQVVFAYSDISLDYVMRQAARVMAAGASFVLLSPEQTMISARKPVVAVCAVRTGAGKSQTTRYVSQQLKKMGLTTAVVRHPMPYGNLAAQAVQRFATYDDLARHNCTIEEREEYESHLDIGNLVFAGVDYAGILAAAEAEADVVLWDGGNNDMPFFRPDLMIVLVDPLRAGHELAYYPSEINLRMADVVVINKVDRASFEQIQTVRANVRQVNPDAIMVEAASPVFVEDPAAIRGKRVLVIEDGPTLTHGGMTYGAGVVAADKLGAAELVDPRPYAVGTIADTFAKYPDTGILLPAMGYSDQQIADLERTINDTPCDLVLIATPFDLRKVVNITHPTDRVSYELQVIGVPGLDEVLAGFAKVK